MTIDVAYNGTIVNLPADLKWVDEFTWTPVEQSVEYTITGAMVVQTGVKLGGRPITLQPEDNESAWVSRSNLQTLLTWSEVAGRQMQLTIRGQNRTVMFRHHELPAISAEPVVHYSDGDVSSGDYYLVTLKFIEV